MHRDPPPIRPSICRPPSVSTLTIWKPPVVGHNDSRALWTCELIFVVAEIDVESDFNRDFDNNEGKYWSRSLVDKLEVSRMFLVLILSCFAPDRVGDSAPNVGDGSRRDGQDQDPARVPARLVTQGEPQEIVTPRPFNEQQSESWIFMPSRQEESYDNLHPGEHYPHLDQGYEPSLSQLPQKKRSALRRFGSKLREIFRRHSTSGPPP